MAKSRNPRGVFGIRSSGSSSPPWSLILAALLCVCMFYFMLLAIGIFSLLVSFDNAPKSDRTTIHGRSVAEKKEWGQEGSIWT